MQDEINAITLNPITQTNLPIQNRGSSKLLLYLSYPLVIIVTFLAVSTYYKPKTDSSNQVVPPVPTTNTFSLLNFIKQNCETNQPLSNKLNNFDQLFLTLPTLTSSYAESCVSTTDLNNEPSGTYLSFQTPTKQEINIYGDSASFYLNRGGYPEIGPLSVFIGYKNDIRYSYTLSHGDGGCITPEYVGLVLRGEKDIKIGSEVAHVAVTQTAWPAGDSTLIKYLEPEIIACDSELGGGDKTISPFSEQHILSSIFPSGITGVNPLSVEIQNITNTLEQVGLTNSQI
jgi:hypothetical protein